jgi:hypothetical protein
MRILLSRSAMQLDDLPSTCASASRDGVCITTAHNLSNSSRRIFTPDCRFAVLRAAIHLPANVSPAPPCAAGAAPCWPNAAFAIASMNAFPGFLNAMRKHSLTDWHFPLHILCCQTTLAFLSLDNLANNSLWRDTLNTMASTCTTSAFAAVALLVATSASTASAQLTSCDE